MTLSLDDLSRSELLELINHINESSDRLTKEKISTYLAERGTAKGNPKKQPKKPSKPFDMSKYRQRHVAFHVQYDGADFCGFAEQNSEKSGTDETVEFHIFAALTKLRLITDRRSCQYSRCGRTDRGVSAFGQVIAARVR